MSTFKKATKAQSKARVGLCGPAGSGKTYTGLILATNLGKKIAVIDTERGSASKYAHKFSFDVLELTNFAPQNYVAAIKAAEAEGYDVVLIDSLSHAWNAEGGVLEIVDNAAARAKGNSYAGWREGTPAHNSLVNAMLQSRMHVIATMRSKTEYVLEKDERTGKQVPRKVGMAPVQRDGMEYEFDIVGDLDYENSFVVTKTRCEDLSGKVIRKPGPEFAATILAWLTDGAPAPEPAPVKPPTPTNANGAQAKPQAPSIPSNPQPDNDIPPVDDADAAKAAVTAQITRYHTVLSPLVEKEAVRKDLLRWAYATYLQSKAPKGTTITPVESTREIPADMIDKMRRSLEVKSQDELGDLWGNWCINYASPRPEEVPA